ncbi:MAG: efflux RND transporter permease subunit [Candidatus Kerfeldbacteria bacterium]|nr:efflux RND transporter permease subunit [Candidatus Kerfeldbacteria bacterium]
MNEQTLSIHTRITRYFLNNKRLTILTFLFLVGVGVMSVFSLRTTGFPSAEIKFVLVQSVYPGASADAMVKEVVQPLEGAIKNIAGIETYTSQSFNSFSSISIQVAQNVSTDSVRSQIDSAVRSVELPDGVTPTVISPDFNNPDLVLSVVAESNEAMYELTQRLIGDIQELPETRSVEQYIELQKQLKVTVDADAAQRQGVTVAAVRTALSTIGELLPVASDLTIDTENQSLVTTAPTTTQQDILNLPVVSISGAAVKLSDVATLDVQYAFAGGQESVIGVRDHSGDSAVVSAVTVFIKTVKDIDQTAYVHAVHDSINGYADAKLILPGEETTDRSTAWVVQHYSSNTFNQNQVKEVVGGLIGAPLETSSPLKYAGWILGGIQLVFLVMLAFVSWRAALIAAIAIPLSLMFSTIYIYLIGEQLNTLVLFSLVLVIGLVVDPALVILESIQRKIDAGVRGKAAAIAAMEDVGRGLFMATLTNIIVFLPFGLISGFLGKFFIFIPYTIIPATIGSYLVPVIFLAWLGGLFLRKNKKAVDDEEKNLWPLAQWIIRTNERILRSSIWMRMAFLVVAFAIPITVAGALFAMGNIKVVQFASSSDPNFLNISGEYLPSATLAARNADTRAMITEAVAHDGVEQIYPLQNGMFYFVNLAHASHRDMTSPEIADAIQEKIATLPAFFDIKTRIDKVGPPQADYEVSLSIKVNDQAEAKLHAQKLGAAMQNVCLVDGKVMVKEEGCEGDLQLITKVDDGFTNKTQHTVAVSLDREKLQALQLTLPNAPVSAIVNRLLRDTFLTGDDAEVKNVAVDGAEYLLTLGSTTHAPSTIDEIKNLVVIATAQGVVRLSDIAVVTAVDSPASILRVNGQTLALVQGRLDTAHNDQQTAAAVTSAIVDYGQSQEEGILTVSAYSEGSTAENAKSFQDLFITLLVAIVLTYVVLAVFFESFTQPIVILFTIPLTFLGIFPGLTWFVGGQFGFLEIIGLIILVGIVENVAIFLIDAARQKIELEKWDDVRAISYAAGVRFRPILLTKFTAIASLAPLAIFSEIYRSIAILIMFGLLTSGFTSLFTTPILFIFFRRLSKKFWGMKLFRGTE